MPVDGRGQRVRPEPAATRSRSVLRQASGAALRGSRQPAACAAARTSASLGRRVAQQQGEQLAAAALALALALALRLRVALDRVGRELVDVGEDRLGQQAELRPDRRPALARPPRPPPGHPRADPVGGLQGVEGAALRAARRVPAPT